MVFSSVAVCRLYGFIGGLSGTVSICTLTAISVDRYYVIRYPFNRRFSTLRTRIFVLLTWIYGGVFSSVPLLDAGLGSYVPEGFLTSCSYDYLTDNLNAKFFILVFFVAAWVVPLFLIAYCYAGILMIVLAQRSLSKSSFVNAESTRHVRREEKKKQELRLAVVVFCIVGLWFVAWTPYAIVSLLGVADRADLIPPLASMLPALFCKIASCLDPFVYALTHPSFKTDILRVFGNKSVTRGTSTRKVWSTYSDGDNWRRATRDDAENESEVDIITMNSINPNLTTKMPSRHNSENRKDTAVMMTEQNLRKKCTPFKTHWWYRPSFSNSSSSIRCATRTWRQRKCDSDGNNEANPERNRFGCIKSRNTKSKI